MKITRRAVDKPYDDEFEPDPTPDEEFNLPASTQQYTFSDLQPSTKYEIQVCASTDAGKGAFVTSKFYTLPADNTECE